MVFPKGCTGNFGGRTGEPGEAAGKPYALTRAFFTGLSADSGPAVLLREGPLRARIGEYSWSRKCLPEGV